MFFGLCWGLDCGLGWGPLSSHFNGVLFCPLYSYFSGLVWRPLYRHFSGQIWRTLYFYYNGCYGGFCHFNVMRASICIKYYKQA